MEIVPAQVGPLVKWQDLRDTIETGDILLCQSYSAFGMVERVATYASYTHICVFLRFVDTNTLIVLESAMDTNYRDMYTGKTDGPKMIEANKYVETFFQNDSGVLTYRGLRSCKTNKAVHLTAHVRWTLYCFLVQITAQDVLYERHILDLVNAWYRVTRSDRSDPDYEFCSETVASIWLIMGVHINRVADKFVPLDFAERYENIFDPRYNVGEQSVYLSREVTITKT